MKCLLKSRLVTGSSCFCFTEIHDCSLREGRAELELTAALWLYVSP